MLLPAPNYICKLLFVMISTRCLMILSADTYYCNTHYKRSAAYACCLHRMLLRTPLKKGKCSSVSWHSWSCHSHYCYFYVLLILSDCPSRRRSSARDRGVALYCGLLLNRRLEVQAVLYKKAPSCKVFMRSFSVRRLVTPQIRLI